MVDPAYYDPAAVKIIPENPAKFPNFGKISVVLPDFSSSSRLQRNLATSENAMIGLASDSKNRPESFRKSHPIRKNGLRSRQDFIRLNSIDETRREMISNVELHMLS
ncbi:MAG: hypothetical protein ACKVT0_13785 [Planctomycetaceae bacterium]